MKKYLILILSFLLLTGCAMFQRTPEDKELERLQRLAQQTEGKWSDYPDIGTGTLNFVAASSDSLLALDSSAAGAKIYQWMLDDFLADISAATATQTNKTIDADDNVMQDMPYIIDWVVLDPADADYFSVKLQYAVTASSIGCLVDPEGTGESVVVDVQECDSNGDNCATVLSSTITCANTPTAGTISDSAWAANYMKIDIGTVTGTVKHVTIYGVGKQSW